MQSLIIQLETLTCPSCIQKIEGLLNSLNGIDKDSIKISFSSSKVRLKFDKEEISSLEIENSIEKLGYEVLKTNIR